MFTVEHVIDKKFDKNASQIGLETECEAMHLDCKQLNSGKEEYTIEVSSMYK